MSVNMIIYEMGHIWVIYLLLDWNYHFGKEKRGNLEEYESMAREITVYGYTMDMKMCICGY